MIEVADVQHPQRPIAFPELRQLNVIERAVIISMSPVLTVAIAELNANNGATCSEDNQGSLDDTLREAERTRILRALELASGVVAGPN